MKYVKCTIIPLVGVMSIFLSGCATNASKTNEDSAIVQRNFQNNPEKILRHHAATVEEAIPSQEDYNAYSYHPNWGKSYAKAKEEERKRRERITKITSVIQEDMDEFKKYQLNKELARLYRESHDFTRRLEISRYLAIYEEWKAKSDETKPPVLSHKKSRESLYKSLDILRNLVRDYSNREGAEDDLFNLAATMGRLGNENGLYYFNQFLKKFPTSKYLPAVYLSMAEYHNEKDNLNEAIDYYKKLLNLKTAKIYPFAVYKLGWAYYKSSIKTPNEKQLFLAKSVTAFKLAYKLQDGQEPQFYNLAEESLFDLMLVWSETGDLDEAHKFFTSVEKPDFYFSTLERRGDYLAANAENGKAFSIYKLLFKEAPLRANAPKTNQKIIDTAYKTKQLDQFVSYIEILLSFNAPHNSWNIAHQKNENLLSEIEPAIHRTIYDYALLCHEDGVKNKDLALIKTTERIYNIYLTVYSSRDEAVNIHYNLATIYFETERFDKAATQFNKVVDSNAKDQDMIKNAAYNAVLALNSIDMKKEFPDLPPIGKVATPLELPESKKALIAAIDRYYKVDPNAEGIYAMRYNAGFTLLNYGHYNKAVQRLDEIAMTNPDTEQGISAIKLVMALYFDQEKWDDLISRCEKYLENDHIINSELAETIAAILEEARSAKRQISKNN